MERKMKPVYIILLLGALLLSACNLPFGDDERAETEPTAPVAVQPGTSDAPAVSTSPSGSTIFMPQQMQNGASSAGTTSLTYFWLDPLPQGMAVDKQRSYADESGFSLELTGETQSVQVMGGDTAFQTWTVASQTGNPLVVRGQPAYSFQTESGVSLHWSENGNYYLVAGVGKDLAQVQGLADSLKATDLAGFQARLQQ
jgi:hypothetical protein